MLHELPDMLMLSAPAVHATYALAISYGPDQKKHNPESLCKNIQIFIEVYLKFHVMRRHLRENKNIIFVHMKCIHNTTVLHYVQ